MTIFLRPHPANKPVKYLESIELSGLVLHPQNTIAMYTHRSAPATGPAGPTGPTGANLNSLYDTIIASCSDELSAITVSLSVAKTHFRAPYALDLATGYIRMDLREAPLGSDFIVDVHMNGATMFTDLLTIDNGELTSVGSTSPAVLSVTDVPDNALFEVFVTQIGSAFSGTGLKLAVTGIKVEP